MSKAKERAHIVVAAAAIHNQSSLSLGELNKVVIRSVGTERDYRYPIGSFLEWRCLHGLGINTPILLCQMHAFLQDISETNGQKSLDQHRQALQKVFSARLPFLYSRFDQIVRGKAPTFDEVITACNRMNNANVFSTLLIWDTGLRAAEVLAIHPFGLFQPSARRAWRGDLFDGRTDIVVTTTDGKGGLIRPIGISAVVFSEMEKHRRLHAVEIQDREIKRISYFDLAGGHPLSQAFSRANAKANGALCDFGIHGLRHAFAQRRLECLLKMGHAVSDAMEILSQELGHFRPSISLAYLPQR